MSRYYIPYSGNNPTSLEINGHRLIVLAKDKTSLENDLEAVGADRIRVIKVDDSEVAEQQFFTKLAARNSAGVLILPSETTYSDLVKNLEDQLPWLQ